MEQGGNFPTVDAIRLEPSHPEQRALRQKFLADHTHSQDEVRVFVDAGACFASTSARTYCNWSVRKSTGSPCQPLSYGQCIDGWQIRV